jgi:hypothetical protein
MAASFQIFTYSKFIIILVFHVTLYILYSWNSISNNLSIYKMTNLSVPSLTDFAEQLLYNCSTNFQLWVLLVITITKKPVQTSVKFNYPCQILKFSCLVQMCY